MKDSVNDDCAFGLDKSLLVRSAPPIVDPDTLAAIRALPFSEFFIDENPRNMKPEIQKEFLDLFPRWIEISKLNRFQGLEIFDVRTLIAGITQAFDDFLFLHCDRTIKFFRGEYPYAKRLAKRWKFLDKLEVGDALIISCPFSATGEIHPEFYSALNDACRLHIPVLVDCAFFGICCDVNVSFDFPCIEKVCFSLSKAFCSGSFRAGIAFSREASGGAALLNEWNYAQLLSAKVGLELMKQFSSDHIVLRYKALQETVCRQFSLRPSKTVIFGLGGPDYEKYDIDQVSNRVCLTPALRRLYDSTREGPVAGGTNNNVKAGDVQS